MELLFDVLERIPEATLDVVGDGDHRPDLEAEIERRGLGDRVRMHGYVDLERKTELYGQAWVNLTASASEGWSLTVMEAALCGTPSGALPVGGLSESIVDGETGVLAPDARALAGQRARADRPARAARAPGRRRRAARPQLQLGPVGAGLPRGAAAPRPGWRRRRREPAAERSQAAEATARVP